MTPALFEVQVLEQETRRLGWRGQILGAPPSWGRTRVLSSPCGAVRVSREDDGFIVRGDNVPMARIKTQPRISPASIRRGITARVGAEEVRIVRPRFGLRRRDRSVFVDGAGLELRTDYRRSRQWALVRRVDDSVVFRRVGARQFLDPAASGAEVAVALVLERAEVYATHSLLNYLTLP